MGKGRVSYVADTEIWKTIGYYKQLHANKFEHLCKVHRLIEKDSLLKLSQKNRKPD